MATIDTVVFDVGETLMNEDRSWSDWADWIGVPRGVLFAALGAVISQREDHRRAFELIVPGFDFDHERAAKQAAARGWDLTPEDFYPDAIPCLEQLRQLGFTIGIAANQPTIVGEMLLSLGLPVDFIVTSEQLGVAKPAPEFFEHVVSAAGREPSRIAYVGDRVDNDVLPAAKAGMTAVLIRRGPWGYIHATWPEAALAHARIDGLGELVGAIEQTPTGRLDR